MIRPISRCLNSQMRNLCQRVMQLEELNNKIKAYLDKPLSQCCQAAAFEEGYLLISVPDATWATELRYRLPQLRTKLRQDGLHQLTSIKIILVIDRYPKSLEKKSQKLISSATRTNLLQ